MPGIVIAFLAVLLSSCASQNISVKPDRLLNLANSSARNVARIASSSNPKASAKTLLEHRGQWKQEPAQLARDIPADLPT